MKLMIALFFCVPAFAQTWFSNVTVKPATSSCAVQWTTAVPTIGHIKYGLSAGSYPNSTPDSTTYSTSNAATFSGLNAGTTYHFQIGSADISKDWLKGLDSTCTTTGKQHSVKLNWQASNSSGVTGYNIYRSTTSGGYYALLGSVSNLTYTDSTVQSGTTYYYVTTAVNSAGQESTYSNQVQAVIP